MRLFVSVCVLLAYVGLSQSGLLRGDVVSGHRRKRSFRTNPWPDDVVPYLMGSSTSQSFRTQIRSRFNRLERNTCLIFVDKDQTNTSTIAPNTNGWMLMEQSSTGYSFIGYTGGQQVVSASSDPMILDHEIGHGLGKDHEITLHESDNYINVLIENVGYIHRSEVVVYSSNGNRKTCAWSKQSVMMYTDLYYSLHGYPMYTTHYANMGTVSVASKYYFYKDISINHECCGEVDCISSVCANEGYKGGPTCGCVCPAGFDTNSNCNQIQQTRNHVSGWPSSVSLLIPNEGCPDPSFKVGFRVTPSNGANTYTAGNDLFGVQRPDIMTLTFCTKDDNTNIEGYWEEGNYCFFQTANSNCEGFELGSFTINQKDTPGVFTTSTYGLPKGVYGSDATYAVCCRGDGIKGDSLNLPNAHPFILLKNKNSECQAVEGMSVKEESLTFDQAGPGFVNSTMLDVQQSANTLTMSFCHYEPLTYGCGGVYALDASNPSQIFTSPNHPSPYNKNTACTWAFTAPQGSQIVMTCSTNIDITDDEIFTVRKKTFGEEGLSPKMSAGKKFHPMITIDNKLAVTFQSSQTDGANTGFSCTATLASADELPYSSSHNGQEYCGHLTYAANEEGFHPCLPWSQVFESEPSLYLPQSYRSNQHCSYELNYCRNVLGSKKGPLCATSINKKNITLLYCDTGRFLPPFDVLDNCQASLTADPECVDSETKRTCFKTCLDNGKITDFVPNETPAKDITCGQPVLPVDTTNQNYDAAGYAVGTIINVKCDNSNGNRDFMCLSTGQWSTQNNFCAACPTGYTMANGKCLDYKPDGCPDGFETKGDYCYKLLDGTYTHDTAAIACEDLGYRLAYPMNILEIDTALAPFIREKLPGNTDDVLLAYHPTAQGDTWKLYTNGPGVPSDVWVNGVAPTGNQVAIDVAVLDCNLPSMRARRIHVASFQGLAICQAQKATCPSDYVQYDGCYQEYKACPANFEKTGETCLRMLPGTNTGTAALGLCESQNSHLPCAEHPSAFQVIQNYYKLKAPGTSTNMWYGAIPTVQGDGWVCQHTGFEMYGPYWNRFGPAGPSGSRGLHMSIMLSSSSRYYLKLGRKKNYATAMTLCEADLAAVPMPCVDTRSDCANLLATNPRMKNNVDFASHVCLKTCGLCDVSSCAVPTPASGVSVDITTLSTGHYATYSCDAGFRHDGTGSTYRACLPDGTLTGTEIKCIADGQSVRQLNYIPLTDDHIVTETNLMMAGPSPAYTFTEASKVLACRGYCRVDADITLQIWRKTPNGGNTDFTYVDGRNVACTGGRANTWTFSSPITVNAGDFLGVLDKTGGAIPFHQCYITQNLAGHNKIGFCPYPGQGLTPGTSYPFNSRPTDYHPWFPRCYIYNMDCVSKPDTMTGSPVIEFNN